MKVTVSIIVPAHNEGHYLPGLLASITKWIADPVEVIVVDNGSTDNTKAIADHSQCQVITVGKKVFPSVARNIGVTHSHGDILVFLDADVEITQAWGRELALQKDALLQHPLTITGDQYHVSKHPSWIERNWFYPSRSKRPSYINGGNLITTRNTFDLIHGFSDDLETGEDVDFCQRAVLAGVPIVINEGFIALHEGYPKTISRFIKRERWHGVGDFQSLSSVVKSKVAIATLLFVTLHIYIVACVVAPHTMRLFKADFYGAIVLLLGLCLFNSLHRFRQASYRYIVTGIFISYLYYVGRSLSIFESLKKKFLSGF